MVPEMARRSLLVSVAAVVFGTAMATAIRGASALPPQGRLAFAVTRVNTDAVAVRALRGGPLRVISLPAGGRRLSIVSLKWGPLAQRLAISDSRGRVFVAGADGAGLRQLAAFPGRSVTVQDWSADGRYLAVDANGPFDFDKGANCPTRQPGLYTIDTKSGRINQIPAHPKAAPSVSKRPAVISLVAWAPTGNELLYSWIHFPRGDCRIQNSATVVTAIAANGAAARDVAALEWPANSMSWSPDRKLLAMTTACEHDVPIHWVNNRTLVIVTTYDGCELRILGNSQQDKRVIYFHPSATFGGEPGTVLYSVGRTGKVESLQAIEQEGEPFTGIGTLNDGSGTVAMQQAPSNLFLLSSEQAAPAPLMPAAPPRGMTLGTVAAAR